jgi:hypothetical protein
MLNGWGQTCPDRWVPTRLRRHVVGPWRRLRWDREARGRLDPDVDDAPPDPRPGLGEERDADRDARRDGLWNLNVLRRMLLSQGLYPDDMPGADPVCRARVDPPVLA